MATKASIAKTREDAIQSLKKSCSVIAGQLGVIPPDFSFTFRDWDYQQAEELRVLAEFHNRLLEALQSATNEAPINQERISDDGNTKAPTKKLRA